MQRAILGRWLWDLVADTALLADLGAPRMVERPGGSCRFLPQERQCCFSDPQ